MDDMDELLALVEEDDKNEDGAEKIDVNESSSLEEEYAKLEKQMKEIQKKMKKNTQSISSDSQKYAESSQNIAQSSTSNSIVTSEKSNATSFLSAFSGTPFLTNSNGEHIKKVNATEQKTKRSLDRSNIENELPPQKKRRVANPLQSSSDSSSSSNINYKDTSKNIQTKNLHSVNPPRGKAKHCDEPRIEGVEHFSRIRLRKCFVPNSEMKTRMEGKRFLRISLIRTTMKMSEDTDWVTVGVISKQIERQAKSGKSFSILNLTDLDDCTKIVSFFMFGAVHEKLSRKVAVGSVIGILNPTIMPPKKEDANSHYSDIPALTVDVSERVMNIGLAADLGWCTATKYRNKQPAGKCLAVINKQYSSVCIFHMQSKYKKASSNRSELQGAMAGAPIAKKFKTTMQKGKNDQFFYGGKLYSTNPSPKTTKSSSEPKIKLTKFLANHSDLAVQGKKELMKKSSVMKALGGIEGHHTVSGCSDAFASMLASGDNIAGSRQFLNHLNNASKNEETAKTAKSKVLSPAEFLRQKGGLTKSNARAGPSKVATQNRKPASLLDQIRQKKAISKAEVTTQYITPADIKKATADMIQARKMQMLKNSSLPVSKLPKLGRGINKGEIDLFGDDFRENLQQTSLSQTSDMKKKKAIAKLRNDDGVVSIPKSNPNRGVLQQIQNVKSNENLKSKILEKVVKNRDVPVKNNEIKEKSKFGAFSEEEFNKILNSNSVYSRDIESSELEEQDKYFNPLIQKEMMEKKMAETFEISCKIVTCVECDYTFWGPHERCKEMRHHLNWGDAKKRFFQCSNCKRRTTTWKTYPMKTCHECGSSKNWQRTSMLKERDLKILDADTLLIRGLEHGRFLNSLR